MSGRIAAVVMVGLGLAAGTGRADVFNLPAGQKSLEFVTVGDPGNAGVGYRYDAHGSLGSVANTYRMSKYDTTAAQYTQFLNAVAAMDTYGLYSPAMANPASPTDSDVGCGITRSGNPGYYTYSVVPGHENFPVNHVTWSDAARFTNWLARGQPVGAEGPATTETGSYTIPHDFYSEVEAVYRNPGARYVLPNVSEWYKAAYYKGGSTNAGYWLYSTRSDGAPSNVLSSTGTNNANYHNLGYTDPTNYLTEVGAFSASPGPYGTFDMGGDVYQWMESWGLIDLGGGVFGQAPQGWGGSWASYYPNLASSSNAGLAYSTEEFSTVGFRVAYVPEPVSAALLVLASIGLAVRRRPARK